MKMTLNSAIKRLAGANALKVAVCVFIAIAIAFPCHAAAEEEYIAAEHTKYNGSPYYIMVNRAQNCVTVYTLGEDGYYSEPLKAMVCSTARAGHTTPAGTFSLGWKAPWCYMVDGSYGQYSYSFKGSYLFHSVCYRKQDPASLMTEEYNLLGNTASLGCVRLQVEDAKWIYDNCPQGTGVTVYDGEKPGALGKPKPRVLNITETLDNGWEPTDPREENPWRERLLPFKDCSYGDWYYEELRNAVSKGWIRGVDEESFDPEGELSYAQALQLLYNRFSGEEGFSEAEASPSEDSAQWYDEAYSFANENGLISSDKTPLPDSKLTRLEMAKLLYACERKKLGHEPETSDNLGLFSDAEGYEGEEKSALEWAVKYGVLKGVGSESLAPEKTLLRSQIAAMLMRV